MGGLDDICKQLFYSLPLHLELERGIFKHLQTHTFFHELHREAEKNEGKPPLLFPHPVAVLFCSFVTRWGRKNIKGGDEGFFFAYRSFLNCVLSINENNALIQQRALLVNACAGHESVHE
jgi:hypothetical protein